MISGVAGKYVPFFRADLRRQMTITQSKGEKPNLTRENCTGSVSRTVKKIAILQSNYIPWKGYFDLIAAVDEFVLFDDMQYTRRDWRNRNRIKTPQGLQWLTVPVKVKGRYLQAIKHTEIDGEAWACEHWKCLKANYSRAPHADHVFGGLEALYLGAKYDTVSHLNRVFIEWICRYLGIETKISSSSQYLLVDGKTERLVSICQQAGADEYISGPAAKDYINTDLFSAAEINLNFFDYSGYAPYRQLWGDFEHGVTVLDLLFNCGPDSVNYMRYAGK